MKQMLLSALRMSLLLAWVLAAHTRAAHAQFDPNCYRPQIGVPGQIDTIVGGYAGQGLGGNAFSPGPAPGSPFNRVFFRGFANNPVGWDIITGGPFLDLHASNPPKSNLVLGDGTKVLGHFHNSKLTDILYDNGRWRIYWSDEQGMYDSSRFTVLEYRPLGKGNLAGDRDALMPPYVTHLTSDTVDDVVLGYDASWFGKPAWDDTFYYVLYKGGGSLFTAGDTALNDESIPSSLPVQSGRGGTTGDFRGTGREDLISQGDAFGSLFFFRNDPPFSLAAFASAMVFDTLYAAWQNPEITIPQAGLYWNSLHTTRGIVSSRKKTADALEGSLVRADEPYQQNSENFWKARPDFGSNRIFAHDTDFAIRSPAFYGDGSEMGWGGMSFPCGDMTGTANPVIVVYGGNPGYTNSYYYVLGEAADPYADMFIGQAQGAGLPDTISADGDRYGDIITGDESYRTNGGANISVGSIELIHGSSQIPVVTNPRWSSVARGESLNILKILAQPSPMALDISMTIVEPQHTRFDVYDVLGRMVCSMSEFISTGEHVLQMTLPQLASGTYVLEAEGESFHSKQIFSIAQ